MFNFKEVSPSKVLKEPKKLDWSNLSVLNIDSKLLNTAPDILCSISMHCYQFIYTSACIFFFISVQSSKKKGFIFPKLMFLFFHDGSGKIFWSPKQIFTRGGSGFPYKRPMETTVYRHYTLNLYSIIVRCRPIWSAVCLLQEINQ